MDFLYVIIAENLTNLVTALIFIIVSTIGWYFLFWTPFDWFRDITDIGYEEISSPAGKEGRKKLINSLIQLRKIGDLPPVYPNGWFVALESADLCRGGVKEVNILGLNLVAWRGESGRSYVSDAYCPHLGAHLGVGGKVSNECIKCPFHGWTFRGGDGGLTNIPYSDNVPEFAKLKMWESVEMNGFIYIWYHAEGEGPSWHSSPFPQIASNEWKYRGRTELRISCHIQEIPENGSDLAHLNIVHDRAILYGGYPDGSCMNWGFLKHVWSGAWGPSEDEKHVAILRVKHDMLLFGKIPLMKHNVLVKQIGPGTVSMEFNTGWGKGVLFQAVTPISPLVQRVIHTFYSSNTLIHPYGKLILLGEAIMIERDVRIWNRKMYLKSPVLTKEDRLIKTFRKWYSQFYTQNSPKFTMHKASTSKLPLDF